LNALHRSPVDEVELEVFFIRNGREFMHASPKWFRKPVSCGNEQITRHRLAFEPLPIARGKRAVPTEALDELNLAIGRAVLTDGRVYVGTTCWAGMVGFRPAFVNWRTTTADADLMLETVRDLCRRLWRQSC
jgi:hypothetical protein